MSGGGNWFIRPLIDELDSLIEQNERTNARLKEIRDEVLWYGNLSREEFGKHCLIGQDHDF